MQCTLVPYTLKHQLYLGGIAFCLLPERGRGIRDLPLRPLLEVEGVGIRQRGVEGVRVEGVREAGREAKGASWVMSGEEELIRR